MSPAEVMSWAGAVVVVGMAARAVVALAVSVWAYVLLCRRELSRRPPP